MLKKSKTVSDEILDYAKKKGFRRKESITDKLAADIVLHHSERLLKEITATRRIIRHLL